jgi:hypothetical protein
MTSVYYNNLADEYKEYVQEPDKDDCIGDYFFEIVSEMEHSRGVSWVGAIRNTEHGEKVCTVENDGNGGCNYYSSEHPQLMAIFDTSAWFTYMYTYEPEETSGYRDAFVQLLDVLCLLERA